MAHAHNHEVEPTIFFEGKGRSWPGTIDDIAVTYGEIQPGTYWHQIESPELILVTSGKVYHKTKWEKENGYGSFGFLKGQAFNFPVGTPEELTVPEADNPYNFSHAPQFEYVCFYPTTSEEAKRALAAVQKLGGHTTRFAINAITSYFQAEGNGY